MDKKYERLFKKGLKIIEERNTQTVTSMHILGEICHDTILYNEKEHDIFYYEPNPINYNKYPTDSDVSKSDESVVCFKSFGFIDQNYVDNRKAILYRNKRIISSIHSIAILIIDKQKELGLYKKKSYDILTLISIYYYWFADIFIIEEEKMTTTLYFIINWIYEGANKLNG